MCKVRFGSIHWTHFVPFRINSCPLIYVQHTAFIIWIWRGKKTLALSSLSDIRFQVESCCNAFEWGNNDGAQSYRRFHDQIQQPLRDRGKKGENWNAMWLLCRCSFGGSSLKFKGHPDVESSPLLALRAWVDVEPQERFTAIITESRRSGVVLLRDRAHSSLWFSRSSQIKQSCSLTENTSLYCPEYLTVSIKRCTSKTWIAWITVTY